MSWDMLEFLLKLVVLKKKYEFEIKLLIERESNMHPPFITTQNYNIPHFPSFEFNSKKHLSMLWY